MATDHENPFRIHGAVRKPFFTDREEEIAIFRRVLMEPGAKMMVYGQRRMGKTSTLDNAVEAVNAGGGHAFLADISTVTTVADMANRILDGATKILGRRWTTFISDFVTRFQGGVKVAPDPVTGLLGASLELGVRQENLEVQQASLARVLDTLNDLAKARGVTLGLVLDEFQEITRLAGEQGEWHLRGVMQHHHNMSYIVAGSQPALLQAMAGKDRAFYDLLDHHAFGPIDRDHMSAWIDERMRSVGLVPNGAGQVCVDVAGARTRDIVRLARKCVDIAPDGAVVDHLTVASALQEIIDEAADQSEAWWSKLTPTQQNVLRAVAATDQGLTTKATRKRFALESGSVSNTLKAFVEDGRLARTVHGSGYCFDSPFLRGWIIVHALPDIAMHLSPSHIASATDEYK